MYHSPSHRLVKDDVSSTMIPLFDASAVNFLRTYLLPPLPETDTKVCRVILALERKVVSTWAMLVFEAERNPTTTSPGCQARLGQHGQIKSQSAPHFGLTQTAGVEQSQEKHKW